MSKEFSKKELLENIDRWIKYIKKGRNTAPLDKYWELEVDLFKQIRQIVKEYPYLKEKEEK